MGKTLIIAEKPSVAGDIAKALGGFAKQDDYFESDKFVLSSAVGHLLEIICPEQYEAKKGKWSFPNLPVIPPHFDLQPIERNEKRLKVLTKLIKRKDVTALVNACDAGREGELIFRHIVRHTNAKQPIQRLWLQSMTPASIRDGFSRLRSDAEMLPLADAATCRSEADWLVGINGTRVMTAFNSKGGGFNKTTVGRVQTPTLAIMVEREEKIRKFITRTYWELIGTFTCAAGEYTGRWFDETFARPANAKEADEALRAERLWDQAKAEAIRAKCLGKPGIVIEESKPSTSLSPLLFDLTSLQRDANKRFGFSAKNTLAIAQALYEKHKVLTYPRTDSRALPEDYIATVKQTLGSMDGTAYGPFAANILAQEWVKPNKRIFNNAKVSDHFAIIPTGAAARGLSEAEQKIYDMVARRFLAIFYPAAEFLVTTRITRVEGEPFKSEGKVLVKPGWLEVYGREAAVDGEDSANQLVPIQPNEQVATKDIELKQAQTKPPPRYSEATLLSAMEGAGKLVEDEELREAMAERGLGTPATRAAIIEGLITEEYIHRRANELVPTGKAFMLLALLRGLGIEELTKPELTGEWEFKLLQMAQGRLSRPDFMAEIAEVTRRIVGRTKAFQGDEVPGDFGDLKTACPKCGGLVKENYRRFQCQKCDFSLPTWLSSRLMEPEEIEQLIRERTVGPLQGFRSRKGLPFAAILKLNAEHKLEFDFGNDNKDENGNAAPVDFTGKEPLGKCPKCGGRVFENGMNYICEHAAGGERKCDFRSSKIILQQPIEPAQVVKLLSAGRTDLLDKFVSNRTGRAFKAFLVLGKDGKVGFEFQKREPKPGAAARKPKGPPVKIDFTGQQPLGKCPICESNVFEGEKDYVCEKTQADSKPCKFKTGKVILQQPIDRAQIAKLLADGKTDLLEHFVSAKTGRPFSAYLVLDDNGKAGFEFPPREETSNTPSS
ncbi:MAG TPA: DNA topoisomerase III [Verrucomicrobiae bacterium]|nr:DNA topoisomerase III [Verrucomicrobiae bacterium]